MSLIDESGERYVRMANLATVGSHHVNGVARLHSDLLTADSSDTILQRSGLRSSVTLRME